MTKPLISSELQEAATLLGAINDDIRHRSGMGRGRGEQLTRALAAICTRGGFQGAGIADENGLLLAAHNLPHRPDAIGAITSTLGQALASIGKVTGRPDLSTIAVDLSYEEKLVVCRIDDAGPPYFLLVQCTLDTDARIELELSIGQLVEIVGRQ